MTLFYSLNYAGEGGDWWGTEIHGRDHATGAIAH